MSHSCVRSTSPGTPQVSYTQLCKSGSKAELSPRESWPTFPTRVSSMALWNSTHPACTRPRHPTRKRPHHPARTRPHVQSPAPEAKQDLDRQGKTDSLRKTSGFSFYQATIYSIYRQSSLHCLSVRRRTNVAFSLSL